MTVPKAKKRFGQNFLVDSFSIDNILHAIAPKAQDHLVEIGPGMGAITIPLLSQVQQMDAVELDKDLIPILQEKAKGLGSLTIHQQDILKFDLHDIDPTPSSLRVIGNLPYNISTPLLFHLFDQQELIIDMHFMLQQEVAQRLAASPHSKQYGRLSIMAQYYCDIEILVTVPPNAFKPAPKVYSSFVRLTPKTPTLKADSIEALENVVKRAFAMRRKTISNALKGLISVTQLTDLGINPILRPEQISLENYVRMSNIL